MNSMIQKNFLLIALRYLQAKQKNESIQSMIKICFLGTCLATCALTLVVSVMQGFEHTTHEKMQSIYPDLILDAHSQNINLEALERILQEEQYHIKAWSPQHLGQALLYNPDYSTTPTVIGLKGINPSQEQAVNTLHKKITEPKQTSLEHVLSDNQILIGSKLAQQLSASLGDNLQLLYSNDEPESLKVTFKQHQLTVSGIFKTGIDEFDSNIAYCNSSLFDTLFPEIGATQIHMKLIKAHHEFATIKHLKERLNIDVYSWQALYPALVSALKLEKYAMFFILLLIVIIASMNIISLIFMYITQKNKDIALLLSFGMHPSRVKLIFISISLLIASSATSTGLLFAFILGKMLQTFPIISLPDDAYLMSHLPVQLDPLVFFVVFICSIVITLCATMLATKKISSINIAQTLKYE